MAEKRPTKGAGGQKGFWSKKKSKAKKSKTKKSDSSGIWSRKMK